MSNIIEETTPVETVAEVSVTPVETVTKDVKPPKTIIFCLTGKTFSSKFLLGWTTLVNYCINTGHTLIVSHGYHPNKFTEKNLCIGGYDSGDISQKPFAGKTDYDYAFWIDSNTIFTPKDVQKLIDLDKPISSGITGSSMVAETLSSDTAQQKMLTSEEFADKKEPFKVELVGFNFLCVKKGVLESLEYPFFKPRCLNFSKTSDEGTDKVCRVYTSDEMSFCFDMKENGIDIFVDPSVIVHSIVDAIV
jgi:hypothetical protein